MSATLLTVLISFALVSAGCELKSQSASEDLSSLQYIYAFFRHGIRSPLSEPYPTDPNKCKYQEYFPGPLGTLTKTGKQVMYKVGEQLKLRYGKFLGNFSDDKVYISSTEMSRTIMTAETVMAALFPPSPPFLEDLKWQPIPVWQDTRSFDKAYIYNDKNFPELVIKECPKYAEYIQKGYDIVLNPDTTKGRSKFYELLQNYTGLADINSLNSHYRIWDTLQFETLNGLPLPQWASVPQPDYRNKPLYPDLMQPVMVQWFKDTQYLKNNREMLEFYSGPLFYTINKHFSEKMKSPDSHEIMRFHATHDTTLFEFLWALGLKDPEVVGPGDGIIFELHKINKSWVVKVLYYDTNHNYQIKDLALPWCSAPCELNQFIKSNKEISPEDWQQNCYK